jgi:hypothetical protein
LAETDKAGILKFKTGLKKEDSIMKSKKLGLFLTLALVLTSVFAFAQDAPKEEESPIKISGSTIFFYTVDTGYVNKNTAATTIGKNYFTFDQINLNFDHQLGKNFKYRLQIDALSTTSAAPANSLGGIWTSYNGPSQTTTLTPFIREAYGTFTLGDAEVFKVDVNVGLIPTKIIRYRAYMSDLRWIESNMFNGNPMIIGAPLLGMSIGTDGDTAQDMGIGVDFSLFKFLNLSFQVVAGEGVINLAQDMQAANSGKAVYVDLLVVPMKGLFIHAYFRDAVSQWLNQAEPNFPASPSTVAATQSKIEKWFAGGGLGIDLMGIRLGADFEVGQQITSQTTAYIDANPGKGVDAVNFFVLNAWLQWNLNEIAGFPLIVIGKISYGTYTQTGIIRNMAIYSAISATPFAGVADAYSRINDNGIVVDTFHWYAGLGWQFNKNFRIAVIFEQYVYSDTEIYMIGSAYGNAQTPGAGVYLPHVNNAANVTAAAMALAKAGTATNGGWTNGNSKVYVKVESKF